MQAGERLGELLGEYGIDAHIHAGTRSALVSILPLLRIFIDGAPYMWQTDDGQRFATPVDAAPAVAAQVAEQYRQQYAALPSRALDAVRANTRPPDSARFI
jgi:hypothetical protein